MLLWFDERVGAVQTTIDHWMQVQQTLVPLGSADLAEVELYELDMIIALMDTFLDYVEGLGYDASQGVAKDGVEDCAAVVPREASLIMEASLRFHGSPVHVPAGVPAVLTSEIQVAVRKVRPTLQVGTTLMGCCSSLASFVSSAAMRGVRRSVGRFEPAE